MKILFDTSVIVYVLQKPSEILSQLAEMCGKIEFVTITPVIDELEGLKKGGRLTQSYTHLKWDDIIKVDGLADDALVMTSVALHMPVITLDLELARRLKRAGAVCYTLSGNRLIRY